MDPTLNSVFLPDVEDAAYEPYLSVLEAEHTPHLQDQDKINSPADVTAAAFLDDQLLGAAADQFAMNMSGWDASYLHPADHPQPETQSLEAQQYDLPSFAQDTTIDPSLESNWIQPAQPDLSKFALTSSIIDDFFIKNGAYRPPVACAQCQRQRLQCLILQTTSANPNPITSCSSCVALYRDCSLAERGKREASSFETNVPVIGHLHGVTEELDGDAGDGLRETTSPIIPVENARPLRNWLASHRHHPYPSEEEKMVLAAESGLSATQVSSWFTHARRRQRLSAQNVFTNTNSACFRQGSPMPTSIFAENMTPMDRWRNSPPRDDPLGAAAIAGAADGTPELASTSYAGSNRDDGSVSSQSGDSFMYPSRGRGRRRTASPGSGSSSVHSRSSSANLPFSLSARGSVDGHSADDGESPSGAGSSKSVTFKCTFCWQGFRKRYDWLRHERSIHLPGLDAYVCNVPLPNDQSFLVWRPGSDHAECIFCGHANPTDKHMQSHEFQACVERPKEERTFARKDHLWQHLHKFHRCKRWQGWRLDLNLLRSRQDEVRSQCGFCQVTMSSWDERAQHLASHFRRGATKEDWTGSGTIRLPDGTELPRKDL